MMPLQAPTRIAVVWATLSVISWAMPAARGQPSESARGSAPSRGPDINDTPGAEAHPFSMRDWWNSSTMTGDWNGARRDFEERGIRSNLFLNDQYEGVIGGGLDTEDWRNSASMDAIFTFDLEKLGVIPGADVLFHAQSNWGGGINVRTGSTFQVNDDADGDLGLHVAQLWYRQRFLEDRAALTVGFLDFQTLVDRNAFANSEDKQFMHQALDNNPLIPLNIGLGASLLIRPWPWYSVTLGVGDAQSVLYKPGFSTAFHDENWWFAYLEQGAQLRIPTDRGPLEGNYRLGLIYDPRPRPVFRDPNSNRPQRQDGHDYGLYVSFDQMLLRESPDDEQGLGLFGRFAYRTSETNTLSQFYSAGVMYTGLLPERNEDVLGFGLALSRVSEDFRNFLNTGADRETVYELYYAIQINKWLVITPDLQYIDNPGARGDLSHAVVAGLRTRITF